MATQNRPVIGYVDCTDCETRATVHQQQRGKARFLYKRCECGCDQRTGAAVQTRLFYGMERVVDDVEIKRPPNVPEEKPENLGSTKVRAVLVEPEEQPKPEPEEPKEITPPQPNKEPKGSGFAAFAVMGVGAAFLLKLMSGSL